MITTRRTLNAREIPEGVVPLATRLKRLVKSEFIHTVNFCEYRRKVQAVYNGPRGALLIAFSMLSGHLSLGGRLLQSSAFDLTGRKRILDVGSGPGQLAGWVLRRCDVGASLTCVDLSRRMLQRSRRRLKNRMTLSVAGDITRLPFADESFDCITCGYVLEHLPNAQLGLAELARVLIPGGTLLLVTTEDNQLGAWTSRLWHCRTYNRDELRRNCQQVNLTWRRELWYSRIHQALKAGGICAELQKRG